MLPGCLLEQLRRSEGTLFHGFLGQFRLAGQNGQDRAQLLQRQEIDGGGKKGFPAAVIVGRQELFQNQPLLFQLGKVDFCTQFPG